MKRTTVFLLSSLFVLAQLLGGLSYAAYPSKPIVMVTHSSPGAGGDIFLRNLAKHMEPIAKASLVVENRPGGGGAIALNYVSTARPDGYVVLGVTPTFLQTPLLGKTARSYRDTTPIVNVFTDPMILYVRYDSPFKSAKEIIEDAKRHPGKQRWGGATPGSVEHMIAHQIQKVAKINIVPVTFEGGGDLLVAVLGGHVDLGLGEPGEVMGQVEAKKVRILANFTGGRLAQLPDVPTMKELGYDIVVEKFRGIVGPKGLPAEVLRFWEEKVSQTLQDPSYKKYYESVNLVPSFMGSKAYTKYVEKKNGELTEYLKEIGLYKKAQGKK